VRPRCSKLRVSRLVIATLISIGATLAISNSRADQMRSLQLEVHLRGRSIHLVSAFRQARDGSISAKRSELEAIGLKVPEGFREDQDVPLTEIPGARYRYDEVRQSIDFDVPDTRLLPKQYDAMPRDSASSRVDRAGTGLVVNYTLSGAMGRDPLGDWQYQGASAVIDARAFGYFGVLSQSAIVTSSSIETGAAKDLRLDSSWSYSDPDTLRTYRAGDMISSGLAWTRPIRLGGVQVERNFALRPDLITLPLPNVSGSAAVPSTVDVYVNNVRQVSQDVSSGPFRINNIPILTGNGQAQIVLRDASGRETQTTLPFFASDKLLREGLSDFSAEFGYPRLFYGSRSDDYGSDPVASASARYGLTDRLTIETHAEAMRGFGNAGIGGVFGANALGLFGAAIAGSWRAGSRGAQAYASYQTQIFGVSLDASTQRTLANYEDLASVTAQSQLLSPQINQVATLQSYLNTAPISNVASLTPLLSIKPARALDRVSIGIPTPFWGGAVNLAYAHIQYASSDRSQIINASYTRPIRANGSFYLTAYGDLDHRKNLGIFAGVSLPLGHDVTASVGATHDSTGSYLATEVAKPLPQEPDSYGWRLRDVEGASDRQLRSGSFAYRADQGLAQVTATQGRAGLSGSAQVDGAVVAAGGGVFLANRIDDAFAVVNAGAPRVDVLDENRVVAQTNGAGLAIVPTLHAYQGNKIAIDPRNLPLNAAIDTTQQMVTPPDRAGVVVNFGVRTQTHSAIIILHDRDGRPLQAGLRGITNRGEAFFVGHDGRAFVSGLAASNILTVRRFDDQCQASVAYAPRGEAQVVIGPVICR
jgi:outer membrane usher protein